MTTLTPRELTDRSRIYLGSCHDSLEKLAPSSVSLVVTSPPYDGRRKYKGNWSIDLARLGEQLYRAVTTGGVAAVVIQDSRIGGGMRTGTSIRMACAWMDHGWRLFDQLVYRRDGIPGRFETCFRGDHEHIFVFCKGDRVKTIDKSSLAIPSKSAGVVCRAGSLGIDGFNPIVKKIRRMGETKCRGTVWDYRGTVTEGNATKFKHPATFPDRLAEDLVRCFSAPGDLVLDPFFGSGTTGVVAAKLGRRFAGCEVSHEYVEIAKARLYAESPVDVSRLKVE